MGKYRRIRKVKKVPRFWWDFDRDGVVIVESDMDKYPVVARFQYHPKDGFGCAEKAIERAEKYIEDLNAGRIVPRAC